MSRQTDKRVLITGAGARVGRHLAIGLAKQGWDIAVHYNSSAEGAQDAVAKITKAGGRAVTVQGDLCDAAQLDALVRNAAKALDGPLTALINNASTFERDAAKDFTRDQFDFHMDVNLYAPIALSRDFAAQTENGVIINILDQRVMAPAPDHFTYSLSKSALHWATATLAQSLAPGIRVNAVAPGPTLKNARQSAAQFQVEKASTLLGTGSPPDALLDAVSYLLSAYCVTGQTIVVDGGQHLGHFDGSDHTDE
ncbi:SDR family oxidoreductase [Robiginitomaculum antarcticum]|uniref:SDR family oxidoreductase n=1 Tax=Robiginitomaculum antarcticum TaxID=437507 RepID=UPI0003800B59|nr:SDR family oxidoreductase [Robiginitomaculum antarcticum]